jgi:histone-lysine N-methyltransferase SETD8
MTFVLAGDKSDMFGLNTRLVMVDGALFDILIAVSRSNVLGVARADGIRFTAIAPPVFKPAIGHAAREPLNLPAEGVQQFLEETPIADVDSINVNGYLEPTEQGYRHVPPGLQGEALDRALERLGLQKSKPEVNRLETFKVKATKSSGAPRAQTAIGLIRAMIYEQFRLVRRVVDPLTAPSPARAAPEPWPVFSAPPASVAKRAAEEQGGRPKAARVAQVIDIDTSSEEKQPVAAPPAAAPPEKETTPRRRRVIVIDDDDDEDAMKETVEKAITKAVETAVVEAAVAASGAAVEEEAKRKKKNKKRAAVDEEQEVRDLTEDVAAVALESTLPDVAVIAKEAAAEAVQEVIAAQAVQEEVAPVAAAPKKKKSKKKSGLDIDEAKPPSPEIDAAAIESAQPVEVAPVAATNHETASAKATVVMADAGYDRMLARTRAIASWALYRRAATVPDRYFAAFVITARKRADAEIKAQTGVNVSALDAEQVDEIMRQHGLDWERYQRVLDAPALANPMNLEQSPSGPRATIHIPQNALIGVVDGYVVPHHKKPDRALVVAPGHVALRVREKDEELPWLKTSKHIASYIKQPNPPKDVPNARIVLSTDENNGMVACVVSIKPIASGENVRMIFGEEWETVNRPVLNSYDKMWQRFKDGKYDGTPHPEFVPATQPAWINLPLGADAAGALVLTGTPTLYTLDARDDAAGIKVCITPPVSVPSSGPVASVVIPHVPVAAPVDECAAPRPAPTKRRIEPTKVTERPAVQEAFSGTKAAAVPKVVPQREIDEFVPKTVAEAAARRIKLAAMREMYRILFETGFINVDATSPPPRAVSLRIDHYGGRAEMFSRLITMTSAKDDINRPGLISMVQNTIGGGGRVSKFDADAVAALIRPGIATEAQMSQRGYQVERGTADGDSLKANVSIMEGSLVAFSPALPWALGAVGDLAADIRTRAGAVVLGDVVYLPVFPDGGELRMFNVIEQSGDSMIVSNVQYKNLKVWKIRAAKPEAGEVANLHCAAEVESGHLCFVASRAIPSGQPLLYDAAPVHPRYITVRGRQSMLPVAVMSTIGGAAADKDILVQNASELVMLRALRGVTASVVYYTDDEIDKEYQLDYDEVISANDNAKRRLEAIARSTAPDLGEADQDEHVEEMIMRRVRKLIKAIRKGEPIPAPSHMQKLMREEGGYSKSKYQKFKALVDTKYPGYQSDERVRGLIKDIVAANYSPDHDNRVKAGAKRSGPSWVSQTAVLTENAHLSLVLERKEWINILMEKNGLGEYITDSATGTVRFKSVFDAEEDAEGDEALIDEASSFVGMLVNILSEADARVGASNKPVTDTPQQKQYVARQIELEATYYRFCEKMGELREMLDLDDDEEYEYYDSLEEYDPASPQEAIDEYLALKKEIITLVDLIHWQSFRLMRLSERIVLAELLGLKAHDPDTLYNAISADDFSDEKYSALMDALAQKLPKRQRALYDSTNIEKSVDNIVNDAKAETEAQRIELEARLERATDAETAAAERALAEFERRTKTDFAVIMANVQEAAGENGIMYFLRRKEALEALSRELELQEDEELGVAQSGAGVRTDAGGEAAENELLEEEGEEEEEGEKGRSGVRRRLETLAKLAASRRASKETSVVRQRQALFTVSDADIQTAEDMITMVKPPRDACVWDLKIVERGTEKGRGVVCNEDVIPAGKFICEYAGELLSREDGEKREAEYKEKGESMSYLYFFTDGNKEWCVDATEEDENLGYGRLFNHSRLNPNMVTRIVTIGNEPHIAFFALRDIKKGEEMLFDYGDRESELEWLENS